MSRKISQQENEIFLEIYRQNYIHVRHLQKMRATYFNFYIGFIGISIAAVVSTYVKNTTIPVSIPISIVSLIWIISILTMMRAERWGGHISHNLKGIRDIQNIFSSQSKSLGQAIINNPKPLTGIEFDRPLWSMNRSIETPTAILGAVLCALYISCNLSLNEFCRIIIGVDLAVIPILLWRLEVSNLIKMHVNCCLSEKRELN